MFKRFRLFGAGPAIGRAHRYTHRRLRSLRPEALEDRRLLTITSSFVDGVFTVTATANEDITIAADSGFTKVNGLTPSSGSLLANSIEHIVVQGGPDSELIDLQAVDAIDFSSLVDTSISLIDPAGPGTTIRGSQVRDVIYGGDGDDTIYGNNGADVIYGGTGNDEIYGGDQDDDLFGEDGNDLLDGGEGNDELYGGAGNDTLDAGANLNQSAGGPGDDVYRFRRQAFDTITEFPGDENFSVGDTLDFSGMQANAGVTIDLSAPADGYSTIENSSTVLGLVFTYAPASFERVIGTEFADTIVGSSGPNALFGGGGADTIHGGDGDDYIAGGDGADLLHGGDGADLMYGGDGADTLNGNNGADVIYGGTGNDEIYGGDQDDDLFGEDGNDLLDGGEGNDELYGGAGNDTLDAGANLNQSAGGPGDDVYRFRRQAFDTITEFPGDEFFSVGDTLDFSGMQANAGVNIDLSAPADGYSIIENSSTVLGLVFTYAPASFERVIGTEFADTIRGSNGPNALFGGGGADTIFGGNGNDYIAGGDGDDLLYGEGGNDVLDGGDGRDTIYTKLSDGGASYGDVVVDTPAAVEGMQQLFQRTIYRGFPEEFVLANPSATGLRYSFSFTLEGLASYADAGSSNVAPVSLPSAGLGYVYGRVFQSEDAYTTYINEVTVDTGYAITGATLSEADDPFVLALISTENTDPGVYIDWLINWGDGEPELVRANPTTSAPVFVQHVFAQQSALRIISATVTDGSGPQAVDSLRVYIEGAQPFAPENFAANGSGLRRNFSWTQPAGPTPTLKYIIEASENGVDGWTQIAESPSAISTGFQKTVYERTFFRIKARNAAGDSEWSRVIEVSVAGDSAALPLSAAVQSTPAQITLSWSRDYSVLSQYVYRRLPGESTWGSPIATLASSETTYIDLDVDVGSVYEYRVMQVTSHGQVNGYTFAAIDRPLVEYRGSIILLVDDRFTTSLAAEIAQLEQDLNGDGWTVIRHDASRDWSVATIKGLIYTEYADDPTGVKQVFILGHLAVPYSGHQAPDGHGNHMGAWPADVYYGDMNGTWEDLVDHPIPSKYPIQHNYRGDGKFDHNDLANGRAPELAVGRVDMWGMTLETFGLAEEFELDEVDMMRRYLERDHAFRHGELVVPNRGVIEANFVADYSKVGFSNFGTLLGDENTVGGDFLSQGRNAGALWAYGDGGGNFRSASGIADTKGFLWPANQPINFVFNILYGSYFGDWNTTDNFLRAPLAGQGAGLTSVWGGGWSFYGMGLGGTIGEGVVYTQNGGVNQAVGTYGALMGDPSLRMHIVAPPSEVAVTANGSDFDIDWTASADGAVLGYNIYRGTSTNDMTKIADMVSGPGYTDTTAGAGPYVYMVRAVKLEVGNTGSYFNASQGAFGYTP